MKGAPHNEMDTQDTRAPSGPAAADVALHLFEKMNETQQANYLERLRALSGMRSPAPALREKDD